MNRVTPSNRFRQSGSRSDKSRRHSVSCLSGGSECADPKDSRGWKFYRSLGSPKLWLAPMVDGSELPFRLLCQRYGVNAAYTPMFHARIFTESKKFREEHFSTCAEDRPLFVQFCANDPEILLKAGSMVQDHCDAIDLNLGCPQRIARRGNYGAFLMDNLTKVEELVTTASKGLKVPLTVKIRVFDEMDRTLAYVRMLRDAGATIIAVHGRTRDQKDAKLIRADWDIIRRIVQEIPDVPIIANGNIRTIEDVDACLEYTGAAGVMSAQSLLHDPTSLVEPKPITIEKPEQYARSMAEYIDLVRQYPTKMSSIHMHLHWGMREWLAEFTDIREELNEVPSRARNNLTVACDLYSEVINKLEYEIRNVRITENRSVAL
eukprot:CAMPEP_0167742732 /NCGR_PEP_ID=MMETSP0110_2-20121227/1603_1 /TAXON_ID=629695 /ORGANISM="Gymnochlora sp., Strain CCMP2014" /LENGTH=375 /DNA_ID=CAMNT_0007626983 /DNA_START=93 /DNA_END=1217 /DNA_ORIENTATION=-